MFGISWIAVCGFRVEGVGFMAVELGGMKVR